MPHIDAETIKYIKEQFATVTTEQVSLWADQASGGGEATLAESDQRLVALTLDWVSGVLNCLAEPKEDAVVARGEPECGHMQARAALREVVTWLNEHGEHEAAGKIFGEIER